MLQLTQWCQTVSLLLFESPSQHLQIIHIYLFIYFTHKQVKPWKSWVHFLASLQGSSIWNQQLSCEGNPWLSMMASRLGALYLQLHPSVCLCRCWHCCPTTACLRTGGCGVCRIQTVEDRAAMARDGSMEHPAPLPESLYVYCRESCKSVSEYWAHVNSEPALEVIKPLRRNPDFKLPQISHIRLN